MNRNLVCAACGITLLFALGSTGCKRQAKIANRLAPAAQQAVKLPPPAAQPIPNVQQIQIHNEKNAYLASARAQMDQMQQSVAPLQVASARTTGPTRASYDKLLRDVAAKRAAFQADIASIPNATPENWPTVKAKSDHDLVALRAAVIAASSRIPPAQKRTAAVPVKLTQ
jgi:hypothetical protein